MQSGMKPSMQLSMRPKLLLARPVFDEVMAQLAQHFELLHNPTDQVLSQAELISALQGCQALFATPSETITKAVIEACPELKTIGLMAVGYNNVDLAAASAQGVMLTNTPDILTETTADFAWALLLATARRVTEAEHWLRAGLWQNWRYDTLLGQDVHGSTLGILGMGRIGCAIARRARGFTMPVLYHNRTQLVPSQAEGASWVDKTTLLEQSDHLILILPYSSQTHHIIGAKELARMKPTATLINLARGGIVDDAALVAALQQKRLAGAGLDVFENEPALHKGLLALQNVVLTPHIASASGATRRKMAQRAAHNLIASLSGIPPDLVNPAALSQKEPTTWRTSA